MNKIKLNSEKTVLFWIVLGDEMKIKKLAIVICISAYVLSSVWPAIRYVSKLPSKEFVESTFYMNYKPNYLIEHSEIAKNGITFKVQDSLAGTKPERYNLVLDEKSCYLGTKFRETFACQTEEKEYTVSYAVTPHSIQKDIDKTISDYSKYEIVRNEQGTFFNDIGEEITYHLFDYIDDRDLRISSVYFYILSEEKCSVLIRVSWNDTIIEMENFKYLVNSDMYTIN